MPVPGGYSESKRIFKKTWKNLLTNGKRYGIIFERSRELTQVKETRVSTQASNERVRISGRKT